MSPKLGLGVNLAVRTAPGGPGGGGAAATIQRLGSGNGTSETTIYGIGFEAGEILRTLDASDVTTASAEADVNGLAEIDATSLDASDRVKVGVRNAADDAWVHGPITPTGEVYKGDVYILSSLVGAGTARIGSGLVGVRGTTENAWSVDTSVVDATGMTFVVRDSPNEDQVNIDPGSGTAWRVAEWVELAARAQWWLSYRWNSHNTDGVWNGLGVADHDAADFVGFSGSSQRGAGELVSGREVNNGSGTPNNLVSVATKVEDTTYVMTVKTRLNDAGDGIYAEGLDHDSGETDDMDSTDMGTSGKPGWTVIEGVGGRDHNLEETWAMAYHIIPVAGGTEGRIARIVDGAGNAVAEDTFDANKLALIDVHAAFVADPTLDITDLVALRIRDSGDTTTLQTLTPTDDGTYDEEGLFGGDVIYVDES